MTFFKGSIRFPGMKKKIYITIKISDFFDLPDICLIIFRLFGGFLKKATKVTTKHYLVSYCTEKGFE